MSRSIKGKGGKFLKGKNTIDFNWGVKLLNEHKETMPSRLRMTRTHCIKLSKKWCEFITEFDVVDLHDQFEIITCKWQNTRKSVVYKDCTTMELHVQY